MGKHVWGGRMRAILAPASLVLALAGCSVISAIGSATVPSTVVVHDPTLPTSGTYAGQ